MNRKAVVASRFAERRSDGESERWILFKKIKKVVANDTKSATTWSR